MGHLDLLLERQSQQLINPLSRMDPSRSSGPSEDPRIEQGLDVNRSKSVPMTPNTKKYQSIRACSNLLYRYSDDVNS